MDVAAKNDDAAFVRAVFVDTITFGHVRQGVEDGGEGISGFAGLDVGHNFDEHAFVELELGESEFEADGAEEFVIQFGPSLRRIFHALEMVMELIDVLTSILVLIDLEHRQSPC